MFIMLNDGTYIFIRSDSHNYGTAEDRDDRITNILFWVDINGLKNPNVMGRDLFFNDA